uniref:Myb-related protein 306-like n=1 Tax=Nelumbo nucifera TaxID=4432 RepID=A0A822YL74_NELNU|nr:TPA_asm: hypothetical protein HUJ06_005564 [Nelumbo nucifera]
MGRSPCCEKVGLKKGPWTPEEDQKLLAYIEEHGHGSWRALPAKAGLQRCGKSCRLRWTNYLRPDIKRGKFSLQEEQTIIQLHALLGNRWSAIATHLPKRTDNEIKNYWNTHLKKRLAKMGIDPVTHKPKSDALSSVDGQSKTAATLSHMAQWESARLEAEARLVRESKLRSSSFQQQLGSPATDLASTSAQPLNKTSAPPASSLCLDVLKAWQGVWSKSTKSGLMSGIGSGLGLESPTSTLSFSENAVPIPSVGFGDNPTATVEFVGSSSTGEGGLVVKEEGGEEDWKGFGKTIHIHLPECKERMENSVTLMTGFHHDAVFTAEDQNSSEESRDSDYANGSHGTDDFEENKNYWNNILNLVNSSPSDSPVF